MKLNNIVNYLNKNNYNDTSKKIKAFIANDPYFFTLEDIVVIVIEKYLETNDNNLYILSKDLEKNGLVL